MPTSYAPAAKSMLRQPLEPLAQRLAHARRHLDSRRAALPTGARVTVPPVLRRVEAVDGERDVRGEEGSCCMMRAMRRAEARPSTPPPASGASAPPRRTAPPRRRDRRARATPPTAARRSRARPDPCSARTAPTTGCEERAPPDHAAAEARADQDRRRADAARREHEAARGDGEPLARRRCSRRRRWRCTRRAPRVPAGDDELVDAAARDDARAVRRRRRAGR